MYSRINYTTVGIFVLILTTGMIWFAFWLAKYGLHQEFDYYKIYISEPVSGISIDSSVKLHGVDVGTVSKIRINPENVEKVEILLKLDKGIPIKEDMVAFTEMYGITGLSYIQIGGGTNSSKFLKSKNGEIPTITTSASLINEQKAINSLDEVDITLRGFRAAMDKINDKLTSVTEDFTDIKKVANPAIVKLMETSDNFNHVTLKVEKSLDRGDYNLKKIFEPMLVEIEVLSQQVNDLAQQLEQSPNDLLFKSRKPRRGPGE